MEIIEDLSKYNKRQIDFIISMLQTGNIKKSAKIAGITEQTAHNYMKKRIR